MIEINHLERKDPTIQWEDVKHVFEELTARDISSLDKVKEYIKDKSEIDSLLSANYAWRYINKSCDTTDVTLERYFNHFIEDIEPKRSKTNDILNKKLISSPIIEDLGEKYQVLIRDIKTSIWLFREENIPLFTQEQKLQSEYNKLTSQMSIIYDWKEITLPEASKFLRSKDREIRKEAREKIIKRRSQDRESIHHILDQLIIIRNTIANNCGYRSYTDYMYVAMGRYDYNKHDIATFHRSIKDIFAPILKVINTHRKDALWYDKLLPYDYDVSIYDTPEITPYTDQNDLVSKVSDCLDKIHKWFGDIIKDLDQKGMLDLTTRKWKNSWWYNFGISGTPDSFIFMNATNDLYGMMTMIHECGHALHYHHSKDVFLDTLRHPPSEICEVASMWLELLSFEHLDSFISQEDMINVSKIDKLEDDIGLFPRVSKIDLFQQRLYDHPNHSHKQRESYWLWLCRDYPYGMAIGDIWSWDIYEDDLAIIRQKQSHIFSNPFYYIEYAIAQLWSIKLWMDSYQDLSNTIQNYINFMKIWNTLPLPKLFEAGGMRFVFDYKYIHELINFTFNYLKKLYHKMDKK